MWRAYPALKRLGISFEQMARPSWFRTDPHLAWAFYGHRLHLYRRTQPHRGFAQLLALGRARPLGYFVFTSNVDGQFQRAGFAPERIGECHGSIHHWQCAAGCGEDIWDAEPQTVVVDEIAFRAVEPLPRCRQCGELARPNILMFSDPHWLSDRTAAQEARFDRWLAELSRRRARIAIIELGAGTAIPTVRSTSERVADAHRGKLIRINPRECQLPPGHIGLACGMEAGIRWIVEAMPPPRMLGSRPPTEAGRRRTFNCCITRSGVFAGHSQGAD